MHIHDLLNMNYRSKSLTFLFEETLKAARAGDFELASSIAMLFPPRDGMAPAAKRLYDAISKSYANIMPHSAAKGRSPFAPTRKHNWPKISVITPSYNQGKYIRETITSVLSQGYPNLEYIVIDGGSNDETVSIIKENENDIAYWTSEKDRGQSDAINKGFKKATGEILTWLNSDDQFAPNALFQMALAFMTSDADLIAGICEVHENGVLRHRHVTSCSEGHLPINALLDLDKGWNAGQFFFQPEVFFKKILWDRAGSHVREDCYYSMDYELWCRFAAVGAKLRVIGVPIINFRAHPEQKTADPNKFRAELIPVQKRFVDDWLGGSSPSLDRPQPDTSRRIKVAMINDHGFQYGAGIAHQRIAGAFDMAGFVVESLCIKDFMAGDADTPTAISNILRELSTLAPDIVIFGNMHSQWKKEADLVFEVQKTYMTYWLTHDFWLFTGRCPYVGDCAKYLSGCDESCPTADEYPALPRQEIAGAWRDKRSLLAGCRNLTILANSNWARSFSEKYLATFENNVTVERITLGVSPDQFQKTDKNEAKRKLKVPQGSFTIAFSVSSISEKRKGARLLVSALHLLDSENITLLIIGNCDEPLHLPDLHVVELGYVDNCRVLVDALNAADVFVGPSREETLGQVFLEAAMCGTPSIGFAGSGVDDAVIDGITGLLVEDQSEIHLAAAILSLIRNPEFSAHLAETAYVHARNHFTFESSFRSFFEVFKKQGLIDYWKLPHKLSFHKESALLKESPWSAVKGISLPEGPYPEYGLDHTFRWCHGEEIVIEIRHNNASHVVLTCKNTLFESQNLLFRSEGRDLTVLPLARDEQKEISIPLPESPININQLEIRAESKLETPDAGKRHLAFMLLDVKVEE
jgi:glycosyltransferase involved in cell wall biosynthesis